MDEKQEYEYISIYKPSVDISNDKHITIADWLNHYAKKGYHVINIECVSKHPIYYQCILERKIV